MRTRPLSARAVRHAWLTDLIRQAHVDSRGVHDARRVHAELTLGFGITVGHNAVEMLTRRAGLTGPTGPAQVPQDRQRRDVVGSGRPRLRALAPRRAVGHRHRVPR